MSLESDSDTFPEGNNDRVKDWECFLVERRRKFEEHMLIEREPSKSLSDFEILQTIGTGTFGTVVLAKFVDSEDYFAIKVLEKIRLVKMNQVKQTLNEKRLLLALDFHFIIRMEHFFKDNNHIYFVLPFINGGEIFHLLRRERNFNEIFARFYAAQIVLGFEYLHFLDIIYRDLKPENVLIDSYGYVRITDLGFAKMVKGRTYTLCGTPDYFAPEMILSRGYSHAVDWWSLGVFIYEMVAGFPPFYSSSEMNTYQRISEGVYSMFPTFSADLKDLVFKLLLTDPSLRLGSQHGGVADIKRHRWFRQIHWLDILNRTVKPPYIPHTSYPGDTTHFDKYHPLQISQTQEEIFPDVFKDF